MSIKTPRFVWGVGYATGIESIDEQHKRMVNMINSLDSALQQGYSVSIMERIFEEIAAYTVEHFGYEEALFAKYHYPQKEAHVHEHQALATQAKQLQQQFKSGDAEVGPELLEFLVQWWQNHIQGTDMKYVDFLKQRGVR